MKVDVISIDENVVVRVTVFGKEMHFEYDIEHSFDAEILANYLQTDLDENIAKIREAAYQEGFKHGREHHEKVTEFSTVFDHHFDVSPY